MVLWLSIAIEHFFTHKQSHAMIQYQAKNCSRDITKTHDCSQRSLSQCKKVLYMTIITPGDPPHWVHITEVGLYTFCHYLVKFFICPCSYACWCTLLIMCHQMASYMHMIMFGLVVYTSLLMRISWSPSHTRHDFAGMHVSALMSISETLRDLACVQ